MMFPAAPLCVTIGNFDGVHLGHQSLIKLAETEAVERECDFTLITFWPHPRAVLLGPSAHKPIVSREMRRRLLQSVGVANILELPFTSDLASLLPEEFVCRHLLPMGMKALVIGHDFTLGRGRAGDADQLNLLARKYGFELVQAPPFCLDHGPVSSTRLRGCLAAGDVEQAAAMLGRPHSVSGSVTHGHGRGKGLGFPTANLSGVDALLPGGGVYAVVVCRGSDRWHGVTNIGHNPTFGPGVLSVETFLLDADVNLYGETITVAFVSRLRDERAFASADELKAQIAADVARARNILTVYPC